MVTVLMTSGDLMTLLIVFKVLVDNIIVIEKQPSISLSFRDI